MSAKSISGTVTTQVVLGSGGYGHSLAITRTGAVAPAQYGVTAIVAPSSITDAAVTNQGTVLGAVGATGFKYGETGGGGIAFAGGGTVTNHRLISGGAGGVGGLAGGDGGIGIAFDQAGTVSNTGTITGGAGVAAVQTENYGRAGTGGVGVDLAAGGTLTNHGLITGGSGAFDYFPGGGGAGVILGGPSLVTNTGTISGGGGSTFFANYPGPGPGAVGVDFTSSGTLVNHGLIEGGESGDGLSPTHSGDGVEFGGEGHVTNTGTILGKFSFGVGLDFRAAGTLANTGTVEGGAGNYNFSGGNAGAAGVALARAGTITNAGTIVGGAGGGGFDTGGAGGTGVALANGGALVNSGVVAGGAGGSFTQAGGIGGDGGVGVYLNGGTLTNTGTIAGGAPGSGAAAGDAVRFGGQAATLVVGTSAVFDGNIVANSAVADTLILAAKGSGVLSGFGTTITGFTTIDETAHAHWTLHGSITGTGAIALGSGSNLTLNGAVSIAKVDLATGDTLHLGTPGQFTSTIAGFGSGDTVDVSGILAASLTYNAGTLTLLDAGGSVLDTLSFAGKYSQADFGLASDTNGGTDIIFAGKEDAVSGVPHAAGSFFAGGLDAMREDGGLSPFVHIGLDR